MSIVESLLAVPNQCFFCGYFSYICFMSIFGMLSYLFLAVLWSPSERDWPLGSPVCVFVAFPCGVSGRVWCLVVSIPDTCICFLLVFE